MLNSNMNTTHLENIEDSCFEKILDLVHKLIGITIAKNKKSMVQGRLRKRIVSLGLATYEDYYQMVIESKDEKSIFIDLLTTNETYFFRTPRIWKYIEEIYLPQWFRENSGKTFQAWSSAASSGEEAHSLGILCQKFKEKNPSFNYQIRGSDISREMVSHCMKGEYQGKSIDSFRTSMPDVFQKFMKQNIEMKYEVLPEIKKKLSFFEHNLFNPLNNSINFDLILVRNVFIYFTAVDQEKVLRRLWEKLDSKGVLIIGESESLANLKCQFKKIDNLIYAKTEGEMP